MTQNPWYQQWLQHQEWIRYQEWVQYQNYVNAQYTNTQLQRSQATIPDERLNTPSFKPTSKKYIDELPEPVDRIPVNPKDLFLDPDYILEPVVVGLNFPTSITFDDEGRLYVGEGGYSYGAAETPEKGRILEISGNGKVKEIASGFRGPITSITWNKGYFYVAEGKYPGRILRVRKDGSKETLIDGLQTGGDHYTSDVIFGPDGKMYFCVGSATNSAVVGIDSYYTFSWLQKRPDFHDVPSSDVVLKGKNFKSINPFEVNPQEANVSTGAFQPFGKPVTDGQLVKGKLKSTSVMYQANPDGSGLRVYLHGLRNVFGLGFAPNGKLYFTEYGFDQNHSPRPIKGLETMWEAIEGGWYGFPDFSAGLPVTDPMFKPDKSPQPEFVLKKHPSLATKPTIIWEHGTSPSKFDFSKNQRFGYKDWAFVTLFGSFLPQAGIGYKVVRVNVKTGETGDFLANLNPGEKTTGVVHPIDCRFSPSGEELYVLDFGKIFSIAKSPNLKTEASGGILWRIRKRK
ncbi:PQQ-dependent sugar dehydrogenase [Bacillus sp. DJP31]|uniref:PQQ-dependent sugar dehydrogenase n=1 Tax=Bacillus sp. DJP31 TaxID=3409789 RepID=UPI003BB62DA5